MSDEDVDERRISLSPGLSSSQLLLELACLLLNSRPSRHLSGRFGLPVTRTMTGARRGPSKTRDEHEPRSYDVVRIL